jgi:membrane protein
VDCGLDERETDEELVMAATSRSIPGEQAETPVQIPPAGWWQVVRRALKEATADNVPMLAGGVAYFAFLAVFPALIAAISLYGLIADPATVAEQLRSLAAILPQSTQPLIADQLNAVVSTSGGALTIGLIVSVLAALWSASGGTGNLIKAINIAYDEEESRGTIKLRAIALALTLGAIVFVLLTLGLVAVVPVVFDALPFGAVGRVLAQVLRWVALVGIVVVALAVVYRVAPDRDAPRFRWVSVGALVATALWVLGSVGFSLYVNFFGNYNKTYGAVAGVVVLMLWLYLTSYIVLLGAEINAESERQTRRDTTRGPAQPMGTRGAEAADTLAGEPGPPRAVESRDNGYRSGVTSNISGAAGSPPERTDVQSASTSELVTRLSTQVSELVRGELALARSELQAKGKRLGAGAGLGGGAGVLAVGGLLAFLTAAIAALALVVPVWASALIVGVVLLIIAGVLGLLARKQIQRATPPLPEQAMHGVQDDVQTIKEGLHRS